MNRSDGSNTKAAETDPMTFYSAASRGGGRCMMTRSRDVAESPAQKYASNWWTLVLEDKRNVCFLVKCL